MNLNAMKPMKQHESYYEFYYLVLVRLDLFFIIFVTLSHQLQYNLADVTFSP